MIRELTIYSSPCYTVDMIKTYRCEAYLTDSQKDMANQFFGIARYIYNWGLETKIKAYEETQKSPSCFDLIKLLTPMKSELTWLADAPAQAMQMQLRNLDNAFNAFFNQQNRFPRFRSRKKPIQSLQFPQSVSVKEDLVTLPKLGKVKVCGLRKFDGIIKTTTLSRTATGRFFISILVDDGKDLPPKPVPRETTVLGIDLGVKDLAILSNGEKIPNPKHLKSSERRLAVKQRQLSRKKLGSKNRLDARFKVAKVHERIKNRRSDYLHKISHKIVCESQATLIGLEDLNVGGMIKNHSLAKAISDVAWSQLVEQLTYKSDWYGVNLVKIGRFEPSSKLCSACGAINKELTLKDRRWTCVCGATHDRDINAAQNIKRYAWLTYSKTRTAGQLSEDKQSLIERSALAGAMK